MDLCTLTSRWKKVLDMDVGSIGKSTAPAWRTNGTLDAGQRQILSAEQQAVSTSLRPWSRLSGTMQAWMFKDKALGLSIQYPPTSHEAGKMDFDAGEND